MSLHVDIHTTREEISNIKITRRGRDHSQEPNSRHYYIVRLDGVERGHVIHRFGDGADVLAMLALMLINGRMIDAGEPPREMEVIDPGGYL